MFLGSTSAPWSLLSGLLGGSPRCWCSFRTGLAVEPLSKSALPASRLDKGGFNGSCTNPFRRTESACGFARSCATRDASLTRLPCGRKNPLRQLTLLDYLRRNARTCKTPLDSVRKEFLPALNCNGDVSQPAKLWRTDPTEKSLFSIEPLSRLAAILTVEAGMLRASIYTLCICKGVGATQEVCLPQPGRCFVYRRMNTKRWFAHLLMGFEGGVQFRCGDGECKQRGGREIEKGDSQRPRPGQPQPRSELSQS